MKNTFKFLAVLALSFTLSLPAFAQKPPAQRVFAGVGTASGVTNTWLIIPSRSSIEKASGLLTALYATSDKAGSIVRFYTSGNTISVPPLATNSTTTIFVSTTNGMAPNSFLVIEHSLTGVDEMVQVSSFVNSTNLVVYHAPSTAVIPGDNLYLQTTAGSIAVGSATLNINSSGIYSGQGGKPLAMQLDSTSAAGPLTACASYIGP